MSSNRGGHIVQSAPARRLIRRTASFASSSSSSSVMIAGAVAIAAAALAAGASADPTLRLTLTSPIGQVSPGQLVQVTVSMTDLDRNAAAGFQAFVHYDNTKLEFLNASYSSAPFGLAIIWPINDTPQGDLDLAAGINTFIGQTPTTADAVLAYIAFEATASFCDLPVVQFRAHDPPSRLTTITGESIEPLTLVDLQPPPAPCPADVNDSGAVDVLDLLAVINAWGPCPAQPQCCPADINHSQTIEVTDLLAVINGWGPCP